MIIRDLKKDDLGGLAKLYYQFWNETTDMPDIERQFAKVQDNENYILLAAEQNDSIVGSVMGIVCDELYGDGAPFLVIENMIVDGECRKKGTGTALLAELEKRARTKNCVQAILVTETERKDACAFYESLGFNRGVGFKKKLSD